MASKSGGGERMARLGMAVIDEFSKILRDVLGNSISPGLLKSVVKSKNIKLRSEQELLVQKAKTTGYVNFDVTLLYTLIRNLCTTVTQPTKGWGNEPGPGDITLGDDIERIRMIRNKIYGHIPSTAITDADFQKYWTQITDICKRVEQITGGHYVDKLLEIENCAIDEQTEEKYLRMLEEIKVSDQELKELYMDLKSVVGTGFKQVQDKIEQMHTKGALSAKTKVDITTSDGQRDLTLFDELLMSNFNAIVEDINESTTTDDFLEILNCISEVETFSNLEIMRGKVEELMYKLSAKVQWYKNVDEVNGPKIRLRFIKVAIQIRKVYNANFQFSSGSLIMTITFQSSEDLERYNNDVRNGTVKKMLSDVILFPPLLYYFRIQKESINLAVENISEEMSSDVRIKTSEELGTQSPDSIQTCTLCRTNEQRLYCNTCKSKLCSACVGQHILLQRTIHHNVVPFEMRDEDIKHQKCPLHIQLCCLFYCQDCSSAICSECSTYHHQGHEVTDIKKQYENQLLNINIDNKNLEKLKKTYTKIIEEITERISKLSVQFDTIRTLVLKQGLIWHNEITAIIKSFQSEIDEKERNAYLTLKQNLSEMQIRLGLVSKTLQKNNQILNSSEGEQLLSYISSVEAMKSIPPVIHFEPPIFQPEPILSGQFGKLTTSVNPTAEGYTMMKIPDISTKYSGYRNLWRMTCVSREQAWISKMNSTKIILIGLDKSPEITVRSISKRKPNDMTVTKLGSLVYTVGWRGGGGLYHVSQRRTKRIVELKDFVPQGVCSTADGEFLVCMTKDKKESKVVRYRWSFVKQEIIFDEKGQRLFRAGALFVTESTNKDVWVSDSQAKAVVVTDQSGRFKFKYTGSQQLSTSKSFNPLCIDSNSRGHVLVIDEDNKRVHVINDKGNLLFYIETQTDPVCLSVDNSDQLWLCDHRGIVKVVKYLI